MQIYLMFQVDRFFFGVVPMRYLFLLTSGIGLVRTVRQVFFNGLQGVVIKVFRSLVNGNSKEGLVSPPGLEPGAAA